MENKKDLNDWAKELKHDEQVAKKYQGVKNVEDILKVAHNDGYNFSKSELLDFDLGAVAGGKGGTSKGGKGTGIGATLDDSKNLDVNVGDINFKLWGDDVNINQNITQQIQNVLSGENTRIEHVSHHGVVNSNYIKK